MKKYWIFLFILCSCRNENSDNHIPNALSIHIENFQLEAEIRGFSYQIHEDVTFEFGNLEQEGAAGQCQYHSNQTNLIIIDENFWQRASNNLREMVVFHELGHCVLGRGHDESKDNEGYCLSIMRSGLGDCRDQYNLSTREEYLDELFFEQ